MPSLTGSFTIPLDLDTTPERLWPLFAELPLRKKWVRMPGPSSKHLIGGTRLRLNGLVAALAAAG